MNFFYLRIISTKPNCICLMKEDFLHYVWRFTCFDVTQLQTTVGEPIVLIRSGDYLQLEGPDFFNAHLQIGSQKWVGNVEIHLRSSDWYAHHHERDSRYDNVILHVVWEHDSPVFRKDNSELPVLELKGIVAPDLIRNYEKLMERKEGLYCAHSLPQLPQQLITFWLEKLYIERLEHKAAIILDLLAVYQNDWEAVLFVVLAKNFGLNSNGDAFAALAQSISFSIFRKEILEVHLVEALLLGQAGLIPEHPLDTYTVELQSWYDYLKVKYHLEPPEISVRFFKLRPDNFPTIRLVQLAMLYHRRKQLFQSVWEARTIHDFYMLFGVSTSAYWETHYQLDKSSRKRSKRVSEAFIQLLMINALIPIRFAYARYLGRPDAEAQMGLLHLIPPEQNAIIQKFKHWGVSAQDALQSQAILQLKQQYCDRKQCLNCAIGVELLKRKL